MALTDSQKYNAVFYLGYPGKILVSGSTHYNKTIVDRLDNLNTDIELIVSALLGGIAAARAKFTASTGRMLVKKVGDIELNTDEHMYLNKEYKRLLNELSGLLDIPLVRRGGVNIPVCV